MWVRGLKHAYSSNRCRNGESHPMWVRGLKQTEHHVSSRNNQSHPMWVRGLKRNQNLIEVLPNCRTLCGCVD